MKLAPVHIQSYGCTQKKILPQLVGCAAERPSLLGDGSSGKPLAACGCKVGVAPDHTNMVSGRESEDLGHESSKRRGVVCSAIRKSVLHVHIAVGRHLDFSTVARIEAVTASKVLLYLLKVVFLVVVTHLAVMMQRQANADSALEPSGHSAWLGIPFVPSNGLRSLLQHFD